MDSSKTTKLKKWNLSHFSVRQVRVAREIDLLYDRYGVANLDACELTVSVCDIGNQEPLKLSNDHVPLSGHRVFAAAKYLCLQDVPVRTVARVFDVIKSQT